MQKLFIVILVKKEWQHISIHSLLYMIVFYFGFKIYLILTDLPKIKRFNFCELRTASQVRVSPVQTEAKVKEA